MREMKDSGIEWIGSIPQKWHVNPIRAVFNEVRDKNWKNCEKTSLKFTYGNIVRKNDFNADEDDYVATTILNYNIVEPGTIIINGLNLNFDFITQRVGLVKEKGVITSAYMAIYPKEQDAVNSRYYNYLFKGYDICKAFHNMGGGVRKILNFSEFKKYYIPVPPYSEQSAIANFLDAKCAEIDALTADIQTQIDTLKQYKQSVITEAVTKGLDTNVEMKDSGVDWCPIIPKQWETVNPKVMFHQRNRRAVPGERQLTASQKLGIVYQDEFMESEEQKVVTVEKGFGILKHVEPNDFVISMRSFQGGLEYSELRGSISSAYVMLVPNEEFVYPPFYRWFFKSGKYINAIQSTTNLVRDGQAMRYANFIKVPLFIIPLNEQEKIASHLNTHCSKIDAAILLKQKQLAIIEKYKMSLIFEYVTGKKEVPV